MSDSYDFEVPRDFSGPVYSDVGRRDPAMQAVVADIASKLPVFEPWPKIARLEKTAIITEKIDGTNAAIGIDERGNVWAQSRTRIIQPGQDNFGFAAWVEDRKDSLARDLGPGLHFGEWWGQGIQRAYGGVARQFSLFNTSRWTSEFNSDDNYWTSKLGLSTRCEEAPTCHVVPVLDKWTFDIDVIREVFNLLKERGSAAAPGYKNPEGVVIFHTGNSTMFKLSDAK